MMMISLSWTMRLTPVLVFSALTFAREFLIVATDVTVSLFLMSLMAEVKLFGCCSALSMISCLILVKTLDRIPLQRCCAMSSLIVEHDSRLLPF